MPDLPIVKSAFCAPMSTDTRSNTSSRSSVSAGRCWKRHTSSPVAGLSATVEAVCCAASKTRVPRLTGIHGLACAVPQNVRSTSGS